MAHRGLRVGGAPARVVAGAPTKYRCASALSSMANAARAPDPSFAQCLHMRKS